MAITTNRLQAVFEAQTAQFHARLTALGSAVDRMGRSQTLARQATTQLSLGMRGLAAEALGAAGPLGRLGTGAIQLLGGPAGLAAAATAGLIAIGIRKMGDAAAETAKHIADLDRTWAQLMQKGPNVAFAQQLFGVGGSSGLMGERQQLVDRILKTATPTIDRFGEAMPVNVALVAQLQEQLKSLDRVILETRGKWEEAQNTILERVTHIPTWDEVMRERFKPLPGFTPGVVGGGGDTRIGTRGKISLAPLGPTPDQLQQWDEWNEAQERYQLLLVQMTPKQTLLNQSLAQFERDAVLLGLSAEDTAAGIKHLRDAIQATGNAAQLHAVQMIHSAAALLSSIMGGGGIGGILSGIGGLLGLGGVIGAVPAALLQGFGQVVSSLESQGQRLHNERERAEDVRTGRIVDALRDQPREIIVYVGDVAPSEGQVRAYLAGVERWRGLGGADPTTASPARLARP